MSSNIYDKEQKKLIPFAGNSEATAGSLDGLSDVSLSSPTDGQVLTYDAENQVWKNGAGATVIESLGDIADVDLTDLEDGQTIIWDAVEQKWIPGESGSDYLAGFGIDIDANNRVKTTDFVGTQAEWDALTTTEKEAYDFVHITDDTSPENYSPGHAISDGTSEKTQREVLEFEGFTVTDDSVNGKTKVAEIPYTAGDGVDITNKEISVSDDISRTWTGTTAEWNAIVDKSVYDGWTIEITDDQAVGSYIEDAVTEGSLNAVTSGAVYDELASVRSDLNKWTAYNNFRIESDSAHTDVTNISKTDANSELNLPHLVWQKGSGTPLTGMPSDISGGWLGIRFVHYFNEQNIVIEMLQLSNNSSFDRYYRRYNGTTWGSWYKTSATVVS